MRMIFNPWRLFKHVVYYIRERKKTFCPKCGKKGAPASDGCGDWLDLLPPTIYFDEKINKWREDIIILYKCDRCGASWRVQTPFIISDVPFGGNDGV